MGAADSVPGVSGGTIALIVGIYDRLVTAIASLDPSLVLTLPQIRTPTGRSAIKANLRAMDLGFLVILGLGAVTAVIVFSGLMATALELYRAPTNAFFFGLIGASAIVLYGEIRLDTPKRVGVALAGVTVAFLVTGTTASNGLPHSFLVLFLTGMITSSAMLLPGISGAAFLYLLGQYEFLVNVLYDFIGAITSPGHLAPALAPGTVVGVFLTGFGIGIVTIAHIVSWALRTDRATTLTLLVSLMIGALRFPIEVIQDTVTSWTLQSVLSVGLPAVIGIALVLVLDRYTEDLTYT